MELLKMALGLVMNNVSPRTIRRSVFVLGSEITSTSSSHNSQRLRWMKGRQQARTSKKIRNPAVAQGTSQIDPAKRKSSTLISSSSNAASAETGPCQLFHRSDALDSNSPLALKLLLVALLVLLLAILEACAVMRFEHAVLAAEVAGAEAAVADDALRSVTAVLEAAADLFGCAAADRERKVDCGLAGDGVRCERR